jgi:hypothetical protein
MRECADGFVEYNSAMVEDYLKLAAATLRTSSN